MGAVDFDAMTTTGSKPEKPCVSERGAEGAALPRYFMPFGLRALARAPGSDRGRTWPFRIPIARFGLGGVRLRVGRVLLSGRPAGRRQGGLSWQEERCAQREYQRRRSRPLLARMRERKSLGGPACVRRIVASTLHKLRR